MCKKQLNKKFIFALILVSFVLFGVFGVVNESFAVDALETVGKVVDKIPGAGAVKAVIGTIASAAGLVTVVWILVKVCGIFLLISINGITLVGQYNDFINEAPIVEAWMLVRDLCNMFFILILLIIAFGTILKIEAYGAKQLLGKLLLMAILINFSRMICGIFIDFAQVIMLTFINAIGTSGSNFVTALRAPDLLTVAQATYTKDLDFFNTLTGYIAGFIFLVIGTVVMIALLATLVMRVVMIWIHVVLSPFAFLLAAFPAGQTYARQWWGDFSKNVIVGPVLAFFIWMALYTSSQDMKFLKEAKTGTCYGSNQILCIEDFIKFVLSIGLLIGGLVITQQLGGATAKVAEKVKGVGFGLAKKGAMLGMKATAHVPMEYAKGLGYNIGEKFSSAWGGGGKDEQGKIKEGMPAWMGGNLALRLKGKIGEMRRYEDEKATRHFDYLEEGEIGRIKERASVAIDKKTGKQKHLAMESDARLYRKSLDWERDNRKNFGKTELDPILSTTEVGAPGLTRPITHATSEEMKNKTRMLIALMQQAKHFIDGTDDVYGDKERGKKVEEFKKENFGFIDEEMLFNYYSGKDGYSEVKGWKGHDYYIADAAHGNKAAGARAFHADRAKGASVTGSHHRGLGDDIFETWVEQANWKNFALIKNGNSKQKGKLEKWSEKIIKSLEIDSSPSGLLGKSDNYKRFYKDVGGASTLKDIDEVMSDVHYNPDTGAGSPYGRRPVMNAQDSKSIEIATGIKGLGGFKEGKAKALPESMQAFDFEQYGINPEEFGLDKNSSFLHLKDEEQKEKAIEIIGGKLINQGKPKEIVDAIKEGMRALDHLELYNSASPVTAAQFEVDQSIGKKVNETFAPDQQMEIFDSLGDNEKEAFRNKTNEELKTNYQADDPALANRYVKQAVKRETGWADRDEAGNKIGPEPDSKTRTIMQGIIQEKQGFEETGDRSMEMLASSITDTLDIGSEAHKVFGRKGSVGIWNSLDDTEKEEFRDKTNAQLGTNYKGDEQALANKYVEKAVQGETIWAEKDGTQFSDKARAKTEEILQGKTEGPTSIKGLVSSMSEKIPATTSPVVEAKLKVDQDIGAEVNKMFDQGQRMDIWNSSSNEEKDRFLNETNKKLGTEYKGDEQVVADEYVKQGFKNETNLAERDKEGKVVGASFDDNNKATIDDLLEKTKFKATEDHPSATNSFALSMTKKAEPMIAGLGEFKEGEFEIDEKKIAKGRFGIDFNKVKGADNKARGSTFVGAQKEVAANAIIEEMRSQGVSEVKIKLAKKELDKLKSIRLMNQAAPTTLKETKTAMTHETTEVKVLEHISPENQKRVFMAQSKENQEKSREKIEKIWGPDIDDQDVYREYAAEALTSETRFGEKDPSKRVEFDDGSREEMNSILQAKGIKGENYNNSPIKQFMFSQHPAMVERTPDEPLTANEIIKGMLESVTDPALQGSIEGLTKAIGVMGDGIDAIGQATNDKGVIGDAVQNNSGDTMRLSLALGNNTYMLTKVLAGLKKEATAREAA